MCDSPRASARARACTVVAASSVCVNVSVLQVPGLIKELETDGQSVMVVDRVSLSPGTALLLSWIFCIV